jgi:TolA-binding protein
MLGATMFRLSAIPAALLALHTMLAAAETDAPMRKGREALAAGLWEIAAFHFESQLARKKLPVVEKSEIAIRLAEAWIHGGRAAEATSLLRQSFVAKHPELPFWNGQALAAQGRYGDALARFLPLIENESTPHHAEIVFTTANLQLALDQPQDALASLSVIAGNKEHPRAALARLGQVEILLELERFKEAREILPDPASLPPGEQARAMFLDASLLLAEERYQEAGDRFQSLLAQPRGQTQRFHHLTVVGLAAAMKALGETDAAATLLLDFIQNHPDSEQLAELFKTLESLLPETPSLTDPILERLSQWITPAELPATGIAASVEGDAASAVVFDDSDPPPAALLAHALHLRALGLMRSGTPAARNEARRLLTRLRLEFPSNPLVGDAMFLLARDALAANQPDAASYLLETLRETPADPRLKGEAAFVEAVAAFERGDFTAAAALFDTAARNLDARDSRAARLNAAMVRLAENPGATTIQNQNSDPEISADLDLERALAQPDPAKRRTAIEEFLTREPEHPRVPEARLAAAEAALAGATPDLSFARAQLDTIAAMQPGSATPSPARLALVRLRIEDLAGDPPAAIAAAKAIIEGFPADPAAPEAMLVLGRNLFETRSYNDARLILEKLAATDADPGRAQAAWLLAARSAALVATTQSQQEALILFDKAIDAKGPVSPLARLEKARLLIDMNRIPEAAGFLGKWFRSLDAKDPLHLPAGILLGEALYANSGSNPAALEEALAVYDKLLDHAREQPGVINRIQYLRGRTLEQIPDPKDPSGKRERQAFVAYYSVLETEGTPAEWHYFELCGFRALALLEKARRWPAAVACARKIASFKGPRAEEAATRASQLQLKHMIWED